MIKHHPCQRSHENTKPFKNNKQIRGFWFLGQGATPSCKLLRHSASSLGCQTNSAPIPNAPANSPANCGGNAASGAMNPIVIHTTSPSTMATAPPPDYWHASSQPDDQRNEGARQRDLVGVFWQENTTEKQQGRPNVVHLIIAGVQFWRILLGSSFDHTRI